MQTGNFKPNNNYNNLLSMMLQAKSVQKSEPCPTVSFVFESVLFWVFLNNKCKLKIKTWIDVKYFCL